MFSRQAAATLRTRSLRRALLTALLLMSAGSLAAAGNAAEEGWIDLFNGQDLTGWTPKFTGFPAGENYRNTYRVEDGLLKVRYNQYEQFDNRFGHLFWQEALDHYHLVVEYRFVGQQAAGGPGWAQRNSGIMFHSQSVASMTLNQEFPASIEAQFLGGLGDGRPRTTNNVCTPATDIVFEGRLYTPHCLNADSDTFDGDQWVRAEIIVRGSGTITHLVNGEVVLEYSEPQISEAYRHQLGEKSLLESGYIALQAESHPMDVRLIRYRPL